MSEPTATLRVRVQPRAARDEIAGMRGDALQVRVTAPPEGGKANAAVCKLVARRLRVGVTRVAVVRGAASRQKTLSVQGLSDEELQRALGL